MTRGNRLLAFLAAFALLLCIALPTFADVPQAGSTNNTTTIDQKSGVGELTITLNPAQLTTLHQQLGTIPSWVQSVTTTNGLMITRNYDGDGYYVKYEPTCGISTTVSIVRGSRTIKLTHIVNMVPRQPITPSTMQTAATNLLARLGTFTTQGTTDNTKANAAPVAAGTATTTK